MKKGQGFLGVGRNEDYYFLPFYMVITIVNFMFVIN